MGQSLSGMYIHLVFGTKGRYPFIKEDIEASLHGFMAGIFRNLECPALKINSLPDHIHILFRLSKNYPLFKVVEDVKRISSKWMKEEGVAGFTWQVGYGAFSVSSSKLDSVTSYISKQKEHHRRKTYQEEIEEFFKEYGMGEYDAKYFYD